MCGIIGYVGFRRALSVLLAGLEKLEYRGYDSCGVGLLEKGKLVVWKTKGTVERLKLKTKSFLSEATIGIGHTRWATHGLPSKINAHPHLDCTGKIAVVHNGIVENYQYLKEKLLDRGHKFVSQTDTEVICHLLEEGIKFKKDFLAALKWAVLQIVGSYGIAAVCSDFPQEIVVARQSSPLLLGLGKGENFLASDQLAILPYTRKIIVLGEGQLARLSVGDYQIKDLNGGAAIYQKLIIEEEVENVKKGGFSHFTLKEIWEQPEILAQGLAGRFNPKTYQVKLGGIEDWLGEILSFPYLTIIANGTSYHAGLLGKIYFQEIAKIPVLVENASEVVLQNFPLKKNQPLIFISQSGETADVLSALRKAKKAETLNFGLVNVVGSSVARETGKGVYCRAGYEVGVAATKSFTSQVLVLLLWALVLAQANNLKISQKLLSQISKIPWVVSQTLKKEKDIKRLARQISSFSKIFILGRGITYPLALEAALKIKELAYLPVEALPAGEFKHGPLALVDKNSLFVFLIVNDEYLEKNLNSISEITSRGGKVIVVSPNLQDKFSKVKNLFSIFTLPSSRFHSFINVFSFAVFLQFLAFYLALISNRPIDKPRNLAKSVTVE